MPNIQLPEKIIYVFNQLTCHLTPNIRYTDVIKMRENGGD